MRTFLVPFASAVLLLLGACGSDVEESAGSRIPAADDSTATPSSMIEEPVDAPIPLVVELAGSQISLDQLADRLRAGSAPLVLDVRSPEEYARRHIRGAINIPAAELPTRMAEIPSAKSGEIVVYSNLGERAMRAEETLRASGYTNVHQLGGRPKGWRAAGLPTE